MKLSKLISFVAVAALLGIGTSYSQIVIQHSGANDPQTEGFSPPISSEAQLSPVFDDQGLEAWKIRNVTRSRHIIYEYDFLQEEMAAARGQPWALSTNMRFVEPSRSRLAVTTGGGTQGFQLLFELDTSGDITLSEGGVVVYTLLGGGTDYHEYSLVWDEIDATAALWIDGSIRATDVFGVFGSDASYPAGIFFGNLGNGLDHTHWNDVTFAIIPEPATVALMTGIGALLLAGGVRWRRRKGRRNRRLR